MRSTPATALNGAFLLAFATLLACCVFSRHGVELARYALFGLAAILCLRDKRLISGIRRSQAFLALLTFFGVSALGLIANAEPLARIDEIVNWTGIFIAGYLASALAGNKNHAFLVVVPLALVAAVIVHPLATGEGWSHLDLFSEDRLALYFPKKANHLGLICGIGAFCAVHWGTRRRDVAWRIAAFVLAGLCAFLLLRTGARASFLGTALVGGGWLIWTGYKKRPRMAVALFLAGLTLCAALFLSPAKNNRIISSITEGIEHDESFLQRFFTWNVARLNIADSPLLGQGFDTFGDQYAREMKKYAADPAYQAKYPLTIPTTNNAHNFFLHLMAETGLAGTAAMLWFWSAVVWRGRRGCRNAVSGAVAGAFLISLLAFQMNMSMYGGQVSALLFALAGLSAFEPASDNQPTSLVNSASRSTRQFQKAWDAPLKTPMARDVALHGERQAGPF